ncbi:RCC1 BLIP-II [Flagelloscypha sp. PMI_526]|nr:RCC1 BLIP-II [Flagelloscypha sp. PMI_526]
MASALRTRLNPRIARLTFTVLSCTSVGLYYSSTAQHPIQCDAPKLSLSPPSPQVWGKLHQTVPFSDSVLRHLDVLGNVWVKDSNSKEPWLALKGQDIRYLQLSGSRLFALSTSGRLFSIPLSLTPAPAMSFWWPWSTPVPQNVIELKSTSPLHWFEKLESISAGDHHLLCLTNQGRAFSYPIDESANDYGQLGLVQLQSSGPSRLQITLEPKFTKDPFALATSFKRKDKADPSKDAHDEKLSETIASSPDLFEIPALRDLSVQKLVAGSRASYALTQSGHVLGFGANDYGQMGLGPNVTLRSISTPTEIAPNKFLPAANRGRIIDVNAGGNLVSFTLQTADTSAYSVAMCGNGQWGGLGNKTFTTAQGSPTLVRALSGLQEYDEKTRRMVPIRPESVHISPSGHVLSVLDTSAGDGGRDIWVHGRNHSGELGSGKKPVVDVPAAAELPGGDRVILRTVSTKDVKDASGHVWARNAKVVPKIALGDASATVLYWSPA